MNTVDGYAMSSWERGYGDFVMRPDLDTLRPVPWQEGTALCLADLAWDDGSDVVASPRQILRAPARRGWPSAAGPRTPAPSSSSSSSATPTRRRGSKGYRDLEPANLYNVDYSLLGTARVEPLIRRIRNAMERRRAWRSRTPRASATSASTRSTSATPTRCATADEHAIYKNGAKEIAAQEGMAITFMAKYDEREGSSCHIHFSLRRRRRRRCSRATDALFERFLAGQLACLRELTLLLAPNVNSYKRFADGLVRADRGRLGPRQPHVLAARRRPRRRAALREPRRRRRPQPVPGAERDHRRRACTASTRELELEPRAARATPTRSDKPRVPTTLREARDLFAASDVAREAFGEEVVEHYAQRRADVELAAFEAAVTDWERFRGFERL